MIASRYNTGVWAARNTNTSETAFVYIESGAQPANIYVFANNNINYGDGTANGYSDARISMYSTGPNISLLAGYEKIIAEYMNTIKSYVV
jgi:hypothetical protein